ncbi:NAD(P)-dependent oxidoreductase [Haloarcula sp. S1AR25-5A]|uniref:NAD(P)-dependent oxidoreductase n=1 Tax=Haloarcula terrestris TaxID=2950533 RepID=A0AAE4JF66_9EURY|nr:NAD(P)-dependent oxidoreductase [Haloarcula terrestris]MDS0219802.1 NAD(P)-dependent oxidoreductase [Haloarcula terrestris]
MPESVAVTGGNGRLGQHVLEHLASVGYRTINLSRGKRDEAHSDAYVRTDLLDAGEVYGALATSDPDAVVHLGMIPTPDHTPGYRTYESNVMSSYHVLEAAGELGVDTVALASSFSAIGGGFEPDPITVDYLPIDEDHRLTPSNPYAMGKQAMEAAADGFARRSEDAPGTITSLRFPWVVDDDLARETFVEADRTLAGSKASADFHTQRNTLYAYLHATDAVTVVEAAVEASFTGHERLWLSAPDTSAETPSAELAAELYPDADYRGSTGDDENPYAALIDTSKAERLLDWEPTWSWRQLA